MATKQLRLEVAQLTDVGRKREHNEDNMAYVIPKDQQVMAKKGALFIVADGMGGHAAGEVASEIAVDTVSNVYYQDDNDDAATSLLHAIKRANALIHQRAAENMLRSGMGTTCVSAVLRGNMAYIANVGDSRAYLVRNGQVKQVSQDHSWVAEQVRAGLLTEDQARTHAQRNVITRCLGTQPDVDIDVFPELLEEHDAIVLCTDGLSGLVSDDEIRRIVAQSAPQESVYHLVERANENGGPDNITAIVISVQEVGWEPPGVRHPVLAGTNGRETGEDTIVLGVTPASPAQAPSIFDNGYAVSNPVAFSGSTQVSPDTIATAPQPAMHAVLNKRSRLFYPSLALIALVILGLIGGGSYLYQTLNANSHADTHVQNAQSLITKANGEVANHPATALTDLANAQKMLLAVKQNSSFSDSQRNKALVILQGDFTHSVQNAILQYNKQSAISTLCSSNVIGTPLNISSSGFQPSTIALVQGKSTPTLYVLGMDNKVYQRVNDSLLLVPLPLSSTAKVQGMASNGSQLVLLVAQPIKATPNFAYSLNLLPTDQLTQGPQSSNQLKFAANVPIDAKLVSNGQMPQLIASTGSDVYVVIGAGATQSAVQIIDYAPNKAGKPLAQVTPLTFTFSHAIISMAAFPNHQLFFLLADGTIQSLQFAANNQAPTSVLLQNAIAQPLQNSEQPFTWQTSVPTVTPDAIKSLSVQPETTSTSALAVSLVNKVPHLFIMDVVLRRILELTPVGDGGATSSSGTTAITPTPKSTSTGGGVFNAATPITLSLAQQYASSSLLTQGKSLAVDTLGANVNVLTQSPSSSSSNLVTFNTGPQTGCA